MFSKLRSERGVTDLNSSGHFERLWVYELWPLCSLAGARPGAPPSIGPLCATLPRQRSGSPLRMSSTIHGHGLCTADLARRPARHRGLFECQTRGALPSRLQRANCSLDVGRGQRSTRLAALAGSGARTHCQGPATLRSRGPRFAVGQHGLRARERPPSTCRCRFLPGPISAPPKQA
jgi:hypothetical protein